MKTIAKIAIAISLSFIAPLDCFAGQAGGTVKVIYSYYKISTNPFMFSLTPLAQNSCYSDTAPGRWMVDQSSPQGKGVMATILMARATGDQVAVFGTGTCDPFTGAEIVAGIEVGSR